MSQLEPPLSCTRTTTGEDNELACKINYFGAIGLCILHRCWAQIQRFLALISASFPRQHNAAELPFDRLLNTPSTIQLRPSAYYLLHGIAGQSGFAVELVSLLLLPQGMSDSP